MKDQHDFMDSTGKPRIVVEQAVFRKNIDFDKPETNYYKVGLNHFTYNEGNFLIIIVQVIDGKEYKKNKT